MITPSKFVDFKSSIMGKLEFILNVLKDGDQEVIELFNKTSKHYESLEDFVLALDVLYVVKKIEINFETGIVKSVD